MTTHQRQGVINASPTKSFFVDMLVKDVSLSMAILDLIDNSIDGALRVRPDGSTFDGLVVKINLTPDSFVIEDNCGGIPLNTAEQYAFRFGRPDGTPAIKNSVGRFGVGMKRAIFKLGRKFTVRSTSEEARFEVDLDVEDWLADEDNWKIDMTVFQPTEPYPLSDCGTFITVTELYDGIKSQFSLAYFIDGLRREIASRHQSNLDRGINIRVNGKSVASTTVQFIYSSVPPLYPSQEELQFDSVNIRLIAGLGPRDPNKAGWYVYCNGRMVVSSDQTDLTGWGEVGNPKVPRYHHQYARFRGCAFFESEDAKDLPWNTTKDGLDVDSEIYRTTKLRMVSMMRPIITFLNRLDQEFDDPNEDNRVLNQLVATAVEANVLSAPTKPSFFYEQPKPAPKPPKTQRIRYDRPIESVSKLKECLGVSTLREVGEYTFDWFLENECKDE